MSISATVPVRVPVDVRDRAKALAKPGESYGDVFAAAIATLEQERFWSAMSAVVPDQAYLDEFAAWDQADFGDA